MQISSILDKKHSFHCMGAASSYVAQAVRSFISNWFFSQLSVNLSTGSTILNPALSSHSTAQCTGPCTFIHPFVANLIYSSFWQTQFLRVSQAARIVHHKINVPNCQKAKGKIYHRCCFRDFTNDSLKGKNIFLALPLPWFNNNCDWCVGLGVNPRSLGGLTFPLSKKTASKQTKISFPIPEETKI